MFTAIYKDKVITLRLSSRALERLDKVVDEEINFKFKDVGPWGRNPSRSTILTSLIYYISNMSCEERHEIVKKNFYCK